MPNPYRDDHGHWTSEENDNKPCPHDDFLMKSLGVKGDKEKENPVLRAMGLPTQPLPSYKKMTEEDIEKEANHWTQGLLWINTKYDKDKNYRMNCQKCAMCLELWQRGYIVHAGKQVVDKNGDFDNAWHHKELDMFKPDTRNIPNNGKFDYLLKHVNWDYIYDTGGTSKKNRRKRLKANLLNYMKQQPPGARFFITVEWSGCSSAHIFNAFINSEGKPYFIDAQNADDNVERYFEYISPSMPIKIKRVDNLELNEDNLEKWKGDLTE